MPAARCTPPDARRVPCAPRHACQIKSATASKLKNDAKVQLEAFVLALLGECLASPVAEQVKPILDEVLAPVASTVPEDLKEVVDIQAVAARVVDELCLQCLKTIVTPSIKGAMRDIDAISC